MTLSEALDRAGERIPCLVSRGLDEEFLSDVESVEVKRDAVDGSVSNRSAVFVTKRPVDNGGEGGVDGSVDSAAEGGGGGDVGTVGDLRFVLHDDKP